MANVVVHELGHYAVAASFDLEPKIHFFNPATLGFAGFFSLESQPIAAVEFQPPSSSWEMASVAIAGVLMNAILGLFISLAFLYVKPTYANKTLYLALLIPSIFSIIVNLNVFSTITDGALIIELLNN